MNCKEVKFYLYEYIHNELDEGLKTEIEHHLMVCESCKEELEKTTAILSYVPSVSDTFLPDDLRKRIIYKTINTPFRFPKRVFGAALALFVAAALSFFSAKAIFTSRVKEAKMDYYIIEGQHHNYVKPVRRQGGDIYYIPANYDKGPF